MKFSTDLNSEYLLLKFKIKHEGCWSNSITDTNSVAHTVLIKPFKERNYVFGAIEVQSQYIKGFKIFLRGFRSSKSIRELFSLDVIDQRRKIYRIMFKEKYEDMVSTVMYEHTSLFQSDYIDSTGEQIVAIIPNEELSEVKRELEGLGQILQFRASPADLTDFIGTDLDLTLQERNALHWAYKYGYYQVPRNIHLEDVSGKLGISKSALAESLRKAESKVVSKWEMQHKFLTD
jgi:hypothetical protein